MRSLLLFTLLISGASATARASSPDKHTHMWIFFVSGKPTKTFTNDETEKMQAAHLANLTRLFESGKLLFAGPLGNAGNKRGTVLLKVSKQSDLADCFKPDPYIQNKLMDIEVHPWTGNASKIGKPKEPFTLARVVLVLVKKGPKWSDKDKVSKDVLKSSPALVKNGQMVVWGSVEPSGDLLGTLLFKIESLDEVKQLLSADPDVQSGKVVVEVVRQAVADGTLDPVSTEAKQHPDPFGD
jgi:uncharacterized protein YciI